MRQRPLAIALVAAQLVGCASAPTASDSSSNHEVCKAIAAADVGTPAFQNAMYQYRRRDLSDGQCQELAKIHSSNIARTALGAAAAIAVGALLVGSAKRGGGGSFAPQPATVMDFEWDWDRFRGQNGMLVWVCRGVQTGQFALDDKCMWRPKNDFRWPGDEFK